MSQNFSVTPDVQNLTMTEADTQYSLDLPAGTITFGFHTRDGSAVRFAYVSGKVATPTAPFATVRTDGSYNFPAGVRPGFTTIYFASDSSGKVVELVSYQKS